MQRFANVRKNTESLRESEMSVSDFQEQREKHFFLFSLCDITKGCVILTLGQVVSHFCPLSKHVEGPAEVSNKITG